jgi:ketosteroid isomerase-like protein
MTKFFMVSAAATALLALAVGVSPALAKASSSAKIADAIKAKVSELIVDFNKCDMIKGVSQDAPDAVMMFHGAPNVVGAAADLETAKKGCSDPTQHVDLANETVDVAASGEMAVFHSTYVFNGTDGKTKKPITEKGNYLVGYNKQTDGSWKIEWSIVSNTP